MSSSKKSAQQTAASGRHLPATLDAAFDVATTELLQLFLKKHKDYGKGNILSVKELGIALRISEKTERLKHLLLKQELGTELPANESIEETWQDIAVYAVIAVLLRRNQFQSLEVATQRK